MEFANVLVYNSLQFRYCRSLSWILLALITKQMTWKSSRSNLVARTLKFWVDTIALIFVIKTLMQRRSGASFSREYSSGGFSRRFFNSNTKSKFTFVQYLKICLHLNFFFSYRVFYFITHINQTRNIISSVILDIWLGWPVGHWTIIQYYSCCKFSRFSGLCFVQFVG